MELLAFFNQQLADAKQKALEAQAQRRQQQAPSPQNVGPTGTDDLRQSGATRSHAVV